MVQADGKLTGSYDLPNLCTVLIGRYLDQRDGTILDCNTGLIWLKNANCFGTRTWSQAQGDAAGLADGACGLTDGSSAGDWRQPTIAEFCSLPTPSVVTCPTANAVDSLVNSNFSTPAVGNTAGNGQWKAGNAFVGVQSSFYWSATELDAGHAWYAFLFNGSVANAPKHGDSNVWPVRGGQ